MIYIYIYTYSNLQKDADIFEASKKWGKHHRFANLEILKSHRSSGFCVTQLAWRHCFSGRPPVVVLPGFSRSACPKWLLVIAQSSVAISARFEQLYIHKWCQKIKLLTVYDVFWRIFPPFSAGDMTGPFSFWDSPFMDSDDVGNFIYFVMDDQAYT